MRENGVKDFPDPANGEPLVDTRRIPSATRNGGIESPPCGRAFAVSVASSAMGMARTMDNPRPWWSSTWAVESPEGLEEAVDLLGRDHGVRDGDDGLAAPASSACTRWGQEPAAETGTKE
jgi:hypothetical protein